MRIGAIVLAAGSSSRMGGRDKLLANLAGTPVLSWTLAAFESCDAVTDLVLVASEANRNEIAQLGRGLRKLRAVTLGGRERQDSVWAGLNTLQSVDFVAVHDGARPLITPSAISACIELAQSGVSVITGSPVVDTIKTVDETETVRATAERSTLRAVGTPQVFDAAQLRRAHLAAQRDGVSATDDASLLERMGQPVVVYDIGAPNPKITSPSDLIVAEALLGRHQELRTGIGIDSHRFDPGRRLVLAGVEIVESEGLAGHSDADVLTHAIMDALLGAAGLGDLGVVFGTSDPAWVGARSLSMLGVVLERLASVSASVQSVDATVIAERPRLRPYVEQIRANLAEALSLHPTSVNVAATTAEGMGALGRAEGMAAHAIATVRMPRPQHAQGV